MLKTIAATAFLIQAALSAASAQENPANVANKMLGLTVLEAINVGNSLRMMGDHPEVIDGRQTGKTVQPGFKFDGAVLMAMAIDIAEADKVQKAAEQTGKILFNRFAVDQKGKDGASERRVPQDKLEEYQAEVDKAFSAPANVNMVRIKEADLCLAQKPVPPCTVTNVVPPAYLAALIKIIDR